MAQSSKYQQPVVPDIVKIATQVDVYGACLVLNDCLGHSVDRFMNRAAPD
jgi:hypothetical protein